MATRTKAAKKGAVSAGQVIRDNEYIQRLLADAQLRENLIDAYEATRKAYGRVANGKGPARLLKDKKTHREIQNAATSLRVAADGLRGKKRPKRRGRAKLLLLPVIGGVGALAASSGLRKRVLDLVFGAA